MFLYAPFTLEFILEFPLFLLSIHQSYPSEVDCCILYTLSYLF